MRYRGRVRVGCCNLIKVAAIGLRMRETPGPSAPASAKRAM